MESIILIIIVLVMFIIFIVKSSDSSSNNSNPESFKLSSSPSMYLPSHFFCDLDVYDIEKIAPLVSCYTSDKSIQLIQQTKIRRNGSHAKQCLYLLGWYKLLNNTLLESGVFSTTGFDNEMCDSYIQIWQSNGTDFNTIRSMRKIVYDSYNFFYSKLQEKINLSEVNMHDLENYGQFPSLVYSICKVAYDYFSDNDYNVSIELFESLITEYMLTTDTFASNLILKKLNPNLI